MKVHLIIPPVGYVAQRWKEGSTMPPLGILYVAAVLERADHEVRVTAAEVLGLDYRSISREVAEFDAPLLGLTITTENRFDVFQLAAALKKDHPEKIIMVGGPHATMAGADMIEHVREIDLAVIGEGEDTVLELLNCLQSGWNEEELARVRGIIFRRSGKVFFSGRRPLIQDLDGLPQPAKHLIPLKSYNFSWPVSGRQLPAANMMTSRGCPFNCNFCSTPVTWGRRVRGYSVERLIAEMRCNIDQAGAEYIWFYDDTFNFSRERLHAVCRSIIREKLNIRFAAEIRIDALERDDLEILAEAGLHFFSFGVEAGSERVRREIIHKNIATEKAYQVVDWANELGLRPNAFFIFSHPTETWSEARRTIKIMEDFREKAEISVSILHIYPGTELEKRARTEGVLPADFSWSRHDSRVKTLPAAQGDIPLYKDRFTWAQIGELIVRWSLGTKKISLLKKIPEALKSMRSPRDLFKYLVIGLVYLRFRLFGR